MMMHTSQITNASKDGKSFDFSTYFQHLEDRIKGADLAIANMEYTLAGPPYSGYPAFSAPESYATYFSELGFDIFLAANNHIYDKGPSGAERTIEEFRNLGIKVAGIASDQQMYDEVFPLVIECKGVSIAILNATYGTNVGPGKEWPKVLRLSDKDALTTALGKASACEMALVFPHWGTEYELTHSSSQEKDAKWFISHGADAIVGAHPHVIQNIQHINDVPVFYSLGNAVSNMSAANTQVELMAEIKLVRKSNGDIKVMPIEFTWLWCSRPGGFCSSYTILPIEEQTGRKNEWKGAWEHDKMMTNYERVRKETGINTL